MKTKCLLITIAVVVLVALNWNLYIHGFTIWQMTGFTALILVMALCSWICAEVSKALEQGGTWEDYE